jgi:hypothetical protein
LQPCPQVPTYFASAAVDGVFELPLPPPHPEKIASEIQPTIINLVFLILLKLIYYLIIIFM